MALSFFAGHAFELAHVCGRDRRAVEREVVDLSDVAPRLVVFDKQLNVLNILELHKLERYWIAFQVTWSNSVQGEIIID